MFGLTFYERSEPNNRLKKRSIAKGLEWYLYKIKEFDNMILISTPKNSKNLNLNKFIIKVKNEGENVSIVIHPLL